jgi:hypothetical protein
VNVNIMSLRTNLFCLPSLATLAVISSSLSAKAVTLEVQASGEPTANKAAELQQFPSPTAEEIGDRTMIPVPGTVATSSIMLTEDTEQPNQVAQADVSLARPTRGGSSYIGVGGNVGLSGGNSSLADGNFTVISKIGFTRSLSLRPSAILGDNTTFLIPVTYDFSFQSLGDAFTESLPIAPYVGVGVALKTGDNSETAVLVTGGVDIPLNNRFTATAAVNAGFFDQTDVGLLVGVGYNFSGF